MSETVHKCNLAIVGGGIFGSAVAYYFKKDNPDKDVMVFEKNNICSGNTSLADAPAVKIPGAGFYTRTQGSSLLFGIREPDSIFTDPRLLPAIIYDYRFNNENSWNNLITSYPRIAPYFRDYDNIRIKNYIAGFSGYTPDNQFVVGIISDIEDLLIATGCCGAGISVCGDIGLGAASIAAGKDNPFDFTHCNPERFGSFDPLSRDHMLRCGLARSGRTSG